MRASHYILGVAICWPAVLQLLHCVLWRLKYRREELPVEPFFMPDPSLRLADSSASFSCLSAFLLLASVLYSKQRRLSLFYVCQKRGAGGSRAAAQAAAAVRLAVHKSTFKPAGTSPLPELRVH